MIKEIVLTVFCEPATIDEIKSHSYVLTLGCHVSAEEIENDGMPMCVLEAFGYGVRS